MIRLTNHGTGHLYKLGLSRTEIEICQKALLHDCQQDMADSLFVHTRTVKFHLTSIYRKLDVNGMHGLLLFLYPLSMEWIEPVDQKVDYFQPKSDQSSPPLPTGINLPRIGDHSSEV